LLVTRQEFFQVRGLVVALEKTKIPSRFIARHWA
jgi:hypothetical protein